VEYGGNRSGELTKSGFFRPEWVAFYFRNGGFLNPEWVAFLPRIMQYYVGDAGLEPAASCL